MSHIVRFIVHLGLAEESLLSYTMGVEVSEMKEQPKSLTQRKGYAVTLLLSGAATVGAFVAYLLTRISFLWLTSLLCFIVANWAVFHLCEHKKARPRQKEPRRQTQSEEDIFDWTIIDDD